MKSGTITTATEKGKRPYQEDRLLVHQFHSGEGRSGTLLAVMDGHLGSGVAEHCKEMIQKYFSLKKNERVATALKWVVAMLNGETCLMEAGSTLSLVFIPENARRAYVAILGDSPVMILDKDGDIHISLGHNVRTNLEERAAAEKRGGVYDKNSGGYIYPNRYVGSMGLQMGRALGDAWMGKVLDRTPEVYSVPLGPRSMVVLATDGLVDPTHKDNKTAFNIITHINNGPTAEELMAFAKDMKGGEFDDNATVVVWKGAEWTK